MLLEGALVLTGRDVHVWTICLKTSDDTAERFEQVLAYDEKERARRFSFERLRRSFIVSHGTLRFVLGRYLGRHPAELRFQYGPRGKPAVCGTNIEFNMSHSGNLAAIALTIGCPVGIDLEQIRPISYMHLLAHQYFHPEEFAEIAELPSAESECAFYCCWTRKEAYIKAAGNGLTVPLNNFRVSVTPADPVRLIHPGDDGESDAVWTLNNLQVPSGYAGALAYRDRPRSVTQLRTMEAVECMGML